MVHLELKLLSSVEVTFEQRYRFDVVASTPLQTCVLVAWRCDLTATLSQRFVLARKVPESQNSSKQLSISLMNKILAY